MYNEKQQMYLFCYNLKNIIRWDLKLGILYFHNGPRCPWNNRLS